MLQIAFDFVDQGFLFSGNGEAAVRSGAAAGVGDGVLVGCGPGPAALFS